MHKRFTFSEAVLVLFCTTILASLTLGMLSKSSAQQVQCADRMRSLLRSAHQYVTDHKGVWMATVDIRQGSYIHCLAAGGYLRSSVKELMGLRDSAVTCPSLPRVPRYPVIQGYGSIYNNGSSYDPQPGLYIYSPEYAFIRSRKSKTPVRWSQRIWFADSLTMHKPPYPSVLLSGLSRGAGSFGAVNITHSGKANIGAVDGSVNAPAPADLSRYYLPRTGGSPLRHESRPLLIYRDRGVEYEVKR